MFLKDKEKRCVICKKKEKQNICTICGKHVCVDCSGEMTRTKTYCIVCESDLNSEREYQQSLWESEYLDYDRGKFFENFEKADEE